MEGKSRHRKNGKGCGKQGLLLVSPRTHHLPPWGYCFGQSTSAAKVLLVDPNMAGV